MFDRNLGPEPRLLLPPPRRICHRCCLSVCLFVCLFLCLSVCNFAQKTSKRICMEFLGKVGNGPTNKWLQFGGDPDHGSESGFISRHCMVRRALAEVCTVRVLLVSFLFHLPLFSDAVLWVSRKNNLWKWGTLNSWSPVHSVFICAVYERSQIRGHVSQANLCLQCLVGLHSADNRQRIDGFVRRGEQAACTISQLISNAWYTLAVDTARQNGRLDTRFYGPWTRVVCIDVHWWKAVQQHTLQWKSCGAW